MQAEAPASQLLDLLLGGSPADNAEALTSAALQEYLHLVDVRQEEVLLTLYAHVAERFAAAQDDNEEAEGHGATAAGSAALAAELAEEAAFASALAQLQGGQEAAAAAGDEGAAALAALAGLAAQHAAVVTAVQETAATAAAVRVAAELQQRLDDLDAAVASGAYCEAAWVAVELQKAAQAVPDGEATAAAVAARVAPLRQLLLDAATAAVAGSNGPAPSGATGAAANPSAAAAGLDEAWRALEVLGLLPEAAELLAERFLQQAVLPILAAEHEAAAASGGAHLVTDSPAGSVASSNLSRATGAGGGGGPRSLERELYRALRALCDGALGGRGELAAAVGAALWPRLAGAYVASKLAPMAPQSDGEVERYSRRSSLGAKLELKAVKLGLLPEEGVGPITRHIQHTLNRFLHARRARFVAAARELLLSAAAQEAVCVGLPRRLTAADAPGPTRALFAEQQPRQEAAAAAVIGASGSTGLEEEGPLLAAGEYTISKAAAGAVTLMQEALTEAVRSGSSALAQAMCGAVVDVAALVAALPPPPPAAAAAAAAADPAQQMLLLPYPAALRHNDCHYVAQSMCNLPYLFAPRLQQLVHRAVNFLAPAGRVRAAGRECLHAMVARQESELLGVVADSFRHFAGLDSDGQAGIRCRKGVQQLLAGFRRLGGVLGGVLGAGALVGVAAALVESVCRQLTADILALPDISVDESEQIPVVLQPLVSGVHDAILLAAAAAAPGGAQQQQGPRQQQQAAAAAVGGVPMDAVATALHERTPSVMKLREVCELLDIRMVEIRQRWQEGRLQAIGLSAGEVAHLVAALFEDTDLRRDFLQLLEQQQQLKEEGNGLL